ncbi:MAG TPA: hypothetical protein VGK63_05005 [Candidatus Limnocylindrales bacterium]
MHHPVARQLIPDEMWATDGCLHVHGPMTDPKRVSPVSPGR